MLFMSYGTFLLNFFVSFCVSVVYLISMSTCCRFDVRQLVGALFQFLFTYHYYHMHDTDFSPMVAIAATRFTHMHSFPFLNPTLNVYIHDHSLLFTLSFTMHSHFSCLQSPSTGLGYLGPDLAFPYQHCTFLEMKALPSLQKLCESGLTLTSRFSQCNSGRQCLTGPRNYVMQFVGLHVTVD